MENLIKSVVATQVKNICTGSKNASWPLESQICHTVKSLFLCVTAILHTQVTSTAILYIQTDSLSSERQNKEDSTAR